MSDGEHELAQRALAHLASTPARNPSLQDIESADAVLVLGEDVTHTAPRLALALRQSVRNLAFELAADMKLEPWQDAAIRNLAQDRLSPLHLVCAGGSDLEDIAASAQYLAAPDQPGCLSTRCWPPSAASPPATLARTQWPPTCPGQNARW